MQPKGKTPCDNCVLMAFSFYPDMCLHPNFPQITLIVTTVPASTASQFTADDFTLTENGSLVDIDSAE